MDALFAARGLLSFIAFTEFTASLRCLLPYTVAEEQNQTYIQARLFSAIKLNLEAELVERVLCHTYGIFCALVGTIVLYAAIYAHYKPIANLASLGLGLKLLFILAQVRNQFLLLTYITKAFLILVYLPDFCVWQHQG